MCDEAGGGEAVPRLQPAACLRTEAGAALSLPRVHRGKGTQRARCGCVLRVACAMAVAVAVARGASAMCYSHHRFPP
eukprot:scaffold1625_cov104-Isochrysis_galbana.AAC.2